MSRARRRRRECIVKVQLPVATNSETPMALVYSETRQILFEGPLTEDEVKRLCEGRSTDLADMYGERSAFKQFWYARLVGGKLHLDRRAPWQEW